jgi:hypothetical protein
LPKRTEVAPVKFVPVMLTVFPPAVEPLEGDTPVTVGAVAEVYVKTLAATGKEVPPAVVTLT